MAPPHPAADSLPSLSSGINARRQQLVCWEKALMAAWVQERCFPPHIPSSPRGLGGAGSGGGGSGSHLHKHKALDVVEFAAGEVHVQLHGSRAARSELKVDLRPLPGCQICHAGARGGEKGEGSELPGRTLWREELLWDSASFPSPRQLRARWGQWRAWPWAQPQSRQPGLRGGGGDVPPFALVGQLPGKGVSLLPPPPPPVPHT